MDGFRIWHCIGQDRTGERYVLVIRRDLAAYSKVGDSKATIVDGIFTVGAVTAHLIFPDGIIIYDEYSVEEDEVLKSLLDTIKEKTSVFFFFLMYKQKEGAGGNLWPHKDSLCNLERQGVTS